MPRCAWIGALGTVLLLNVATLSGQAPTPARAAASTFATVEVHVNSRPIGKTWFAEDASLGGPARIAITYGQPHARGRKIEGGLIPLDTVWRFGANMATTLHTDVDLMLGDLSIPRGDYSLFVLYDRNGWQLIVNRGTAQWGTDRDASKDFGRVALSPRTMAEPEEALSIYLIPDSEQPASGYATISGALKIKWGATELKAPWRAVP
jgi:Protein of unknown function (DUF2911)